MKESVRAQLEQVEEFLRTHSGSRIRHRALRRATGLTSNELKYVIDTLSYRDHRLCEDDDGTLLYLKG